MSKNSKKSYESKLKAKVALAAIKGEESILEICSVNNIPKTTAVAWRDKLLNEAELIFIPVHERERKARLLRQEIEVLHKMIGEISVENNFLKKKLLK
jgi:transposase